MAVTPLTATKRYIRPGVTKVYYMPTSANYKTVTKAELDASTDLTAEIAEVTGWNTTSSLVDVPDWGSRYTSKVAGLISADDSSITFYASQDGQDVRTILPRDTKGYIVWFDGGTATGQTMDVFPVTVSALSKERTQADPARIMVDFAITAEPSENQAIPTV